MKSQRLGHYLYQKKIPIIPKMVNFAIRIIHNNTIFSECSFGSGTIFAYGGIGVVIHKNSVIGKNCVIGSNVTIGGNFKSNGTAIIGDNCYIATGAKILGPAHIGDNAFIGANSVVLCDIPNICVVAGLPARVLKDIICIEDYM